MLNKKAIENVVFAIVLVFTVIALGITFMTLRIQVPTPTAYIVQPPLVQPQAPCQIDCDDGNLNINPGENEVCGNQIDDNCDGQIDENCCGNGVVEMGEQCDPPGSECMLGQNTGICTGTDTGQQACSCNFALCQHCPNGVCDFGENSQNCQQDCNVECGNHACEAGEGASNNPPCSLIQGPPCYCPQDCQADCGNGACETGQHICQDGDCACPGDQTTCNETPNSCPGDCSGNTQCAGNALCQYDRTVYDPGDEGGFINCEEDCCTAACDTGDQDGGDGDCVPNGDFPCVTGTCNENGFCEFSEIEGCCTSDSDCNQCESCEFKIGPDFIPQNGIGTCVPDDEKTCTDDNACTTDECDDGECVSTSIPNCPPPSVGGRGGGGGGSNPYVQEGCCGPCLNGKGKCKGVVILDGSCRVNTNTPCSTPVPTAEVPPQAPGNPSYFNQVSTSSGKKLPPGLPTEEALARQQALAGQVQYPEQASRRSEASRASIEGAMAQQSPSTPSGLALLLLVALLLGAYAYFNKDQIASLFKKEKHKTEPIVKEIRKEWRQITRAKRAKKSKSIKDNS